MLGTKCSLVGEQRRKESNLLQCHSWVSVPSYLQSQSPISRDSISKFGRTNPRMTSRYPAARRGGGGALCAWSIYSRQLRLGQERQQLGARSMSKAQLRSVPTILSRFRK